MTETDRGTDALFLRACRGESTAHPPLWMMRQAGRYLPEYKALRERAGSFMGLATNPQFATDVTLQPLERYPLDAAILFSDTDQAAATMDGEPSFPVEYVVIDISAGGARGAKQFAWSAADARYVEIGSYP